MNEQDLYGELAMVASQIGNRLLRNNSGAFQNDAGQWVRFGLGNISKKVNKKFKSGDLIGITRHVILPEDVGKIVGVFTNIEVKPPGWVFKGTETEIAQDNFNKFVESMGGIAGFASSANCYMRIINQGR